MKLTDILTQYKLELYRQQAGIVTLILSRDNQIFTATDHGRGIFTEPCEAIL